ncbi:MAG: cytochrome d ubiquinol oxidase subunit II [Alphaproteobacteria bacterium]|nr:cytochrome d ubiquinol oxidase subunit II [Alphaproteobacteria bacterium]
MPPLELLVALVMWAALVIYTLTGGADFGGGVWDLLATGPRKLEQRRLVASAIAPIWEANHVWLILVVVLLFVCFPSAFAAISTALHVPLTLMLIGIVLRGAAFVFRAYDPAHKDTATGGWRLVFAISSAVTPVMLGVVLGAVASGRMTLVDGVAQTDFVSEWWAPFPFALGAFVLAMCAMLAATWLTVETGDVALQHDLRRRALGSAAAVAGLAWLTLLLAEDGAPHLHAALTGAPWALPFQVATASVGVAGVWALWTARYRQARWLVGAQVVAVIGGFGLAQWPFLIAPDLTFAQAAAPEVVLRPVLAALGLGAVVLLPAFGWLYRVFKG